MGCYGYPFPPFFSQRVSDRTRIPAVLGHCRELTPAALPALGSGGCAGVTALGWGGLGSPALGLAPSTGFGPQPLCQPLCCAGGSSLSPTAASAQFTQKKKSYPAKQSVLPQVV